MSAKINTLYSYAEQCNIGTMQGHIMRCGRPLYLLWKSYTRYI